MADWLCPNCRGGFPDGDFFDCPWCGQEIDESFEPEQPLSVVTSEDESDEVPKLFGGLFE